MTDKQQNHQSKDPTVQRSETASLPHFIRDGNLTDRLLFLSFFAVSIFYLALIPFRAKLLVDAPFLNVLLTGGNLSTLALGAQHSNNLPFLTAVVILAAVSTIKFLPLYFFMGKRWGADFVSFIFNNHKPLWFKWLENFIFRHPIISLGLCFIPFFPASPTIVTIIAGITKVRGLPLAIAAFIYALLLKIVYVWIGTAFGTAVIATLQLIDKYMLWATLALVVWLIIVSTRKEMRRTPNKQE